LKGKTFAVNLQRTSNSIISRDSSTVISIAGRMTFDRLMLNSAKGSFLKDKSVIASLNLELDASQKNILVRPSILKFEKSTVRLSGLFTLAQPGQFQLHIASDELDYKEGLSILNDSLVKKLEKYQVEKPIEIEVNLKGALEPGVKPAVDLTFAFSDSKVTMPILNMENMTMRGSFINHVDRTLPNDAQNSQLHFGLLKGVVNNLPVEAEVTLTDLRDPALLLNATFNVNLKDLNTHLDTTKLKMIEGNFISKFTYTGKLQEYLDDSRTRYEGMLAGKATITNGKVNYIARRINIDNLNATFDFTEKRFTIQDLKLIANKNSVSVNGLMTDFIPFFTSPQQSCKVKLNITSPRLDVSGFTQRRKIERSKSAKAASKQRVSDLVEKLNESLEFDLDFKVNEFVNKNFRATQLKGNLIMANNQFILKNAGMDFAKGKVGFNLKVTNLQKKINPIYLNTKMKDVDLKEFFYAFNDFNQKTFSHNHVEGKLSLDLDLRAEVDDKLDFLTKDLDGVAQFTITDGRLKDFEPMQRLSNFLFKGRDFSDVQFGEITSDINMSGTQMHVSRMEVESTVVTMFIEGRYDLKDSSDLSIQIPLSNLKKRDQDIPPENVGVDSKVGPSVYLRVKPDKTGKNTISYDPFKKFRKKKKNGNTA
ncbi:MAG TPA: AsmA-like C-terminal region-containing protein, partial [Chryseolinea sp.]